ncbi:MAG TPA: RNA polymerase sigma factor [bacterium]
MGNPFAQNSAEDKLDEALVDAAVQGDRASLERLLERHRPWIYNIAVRMVYNPQDAQDVSQEVMLKILLRLSTFRKESSFRTWLYRIVANHVLQIQRKEHKTLTFTDYARILDETPDLDFPDQSSLPVDAAIVEHETRYECMMGMLLCLDPLQRLIFILGALMGVTDALGSEILGISKANFRQKLSRARQDLHSFMEQKCGLVNPANPCRCTKKTKALIDRGVVNPHSLVYNANYYQRIEQAVESKVQAAGSWFDLRCEELFAGQPFYTGPAFAGQLRTLLDSPQFKEIFNLRERPF